MVATSAVPVDLTFSYVHRTDTGRFRASTAREMRTHEGGRANYDDD